MKKLLSKLLPARAKVADSVSVPVITPDISRVIKIETASAPKTTDQNGVDEMASRAEDAVSSLSAKFEVWLAADLERLVSAWETARNENASVEAQQILAVVAHDLHGVATSYGYPSISRLCASLCRLLYTSKGHADLGLINLHVEACKAVFAGKITADKSDPITESVCGALERKVADYAAG